MSPIAKVLNLITKDIYTDKNSDEYSNFFYTSMLHYAITLEIASNSYNNEFISFERLCLIIPKKLGGRSSIKNILDHGVEKKFFTKKLEINDKRVKKYQLSEGYSLMITNWYLNRKQRYAG